MKKKPISVISACSLRFSVVLNAKACLDAPPPPVLFGNETVQALRLGQRQVSGKHKVAVNNTFSYQLFLFGLIVYGKIETCFTKGKILHNRGRFFVVVFANDVFHVFSLDCGRNVLEVQAFQQRYDFLSVEFSVEQNIANVEASSFCFREQFFDNVNFLCELVDGQSADGDSLACFYYVNAGVYVGVACSFFVFSTSHPGRVFMVSVEEVASEVYGYSDFAFENAVAEFSELV